MSCVTLNIVPDKNVVVLSIDANKVNVISPKFIKDVSEALDTILKAPEYKNLGVVITGNKKCFSAGLDLSVLQGADAQGAMKYINGVDLFFYKIFTFPRPVVAAINGMFREPSAGGVLKIS